MAWTSVETIIANPARKRRNVAKRMTLKQRLNFGSKAQRSAAKRALRGKRSNSASKHRKRTVARKRHNPSPKRHSAPKRRVHRTRARKRVARHRSNPGEIISLALNPAKRRKKAVARTKRRKAARRSNAGHRAHRKTTRRHSRRRNPGQIGSLLKTGLSVVGGAVGSKVGAQLVLGSKNTGIFGYLANAAAGGVLAWGAKALMHDRTISQGIIIGTVVQIIVRAVGDFTPYGSFLSMQGLGDYMVSNFVTPQRMVDGLNSAMVQVPTGWGAPMIAAPATQGMTGMYDPLY